MQHTHQKIIERISDNDRGWAFSKRDLLDLGADAAVRKALSRLESDGTIRRVCRGIYEYPRYSEFLEQKLSPDIDQVARALARKFRWRIQPSEATALNFLGLSTQIPGRVQYLSDGPTRSYKIGKITLEFRHRTLKESGLKNSESALIVQALKGLGKERATDREIQKIRQWLPTEKRATVLRDTRLVTGWVYEIIREVCREEES